MLQDGASLSCCAYGQAVEGSGESAMRLLCLRLCAAYVMADLLAACTGIMYISDCIPET